VVRFERVIGATALKPVVGTPKSSSSSESLSESSTTSSPLDTTLLLTPELIDVCDVVGGCASGLETESLIGTGGTAEALGLECATDLFVLSCCKLGPVGPGRVLVASTIEWNVSLLHPKLAGTWVPCSCGASLELSGVLRGTGWKKSFMLGFLRDFIFTTRVRLRDGGVVLMLGEIEIDRRVVRACSRAAASLGAASVDALHYNMHSGWERSGIRVAHSRGFSGTNCSGLYCA